MQDRIGILFVLGMPQASRPWQQQCVWYRVIGPGQALQGVGCRVEYAYLEEKERIRSLLHTGEVDAVILHRGNGGPEFQRLREETKTRGVPLWYDLDDNVIDPEVIEQASHLAHLDRASIRNIQNWTRANIACLAECDGALFSTAALRDIGLRHNKNSRLLPNFLPAFYIGPMESRAPKNDRSIRIYYGPGSVEHKVHFNLIVQAVKELMERFPETELHIGGGMEAPCAFAEFGSRVIRLPWVRPEIYYRALGSMDIVLAPLTADPFSKGKSWIKVLEAASMGCIWVGSDQPSYRQFQASTGTGFLASEGEWGSVLQSVVEGFAHEREQALARQQTILEEYSMANRTGDYLTAIDDDGGKNTGNVPTSPSKTMDSGFTAHNIRLDDGTETMPGTEWTMDQITILHSVRRVLELIYPEGLHGKSIADLGCLEGGYSTEFARLGMEATGIEARESNFRNCMIVKAGTNLPNLKFVRDDANNIAQYGPFDAVFANGLLYHLDRPRQFLTSVAQVCKRAVFLQTHVARAEQTDAIQIHGLSEICEHEGLKGRWYPEFGDVTPEELDRLKWSSWGNARSFWIQKEYLLQLLKELGFDVVFEQFDFMGNIVAEMTEGHYKKHDRTLIVGIKAR